MVLLGERFECRGVHASQPYRSFLLLRDDTYATMIDHHHVFTYFNRETFCKMQ